MDRWHFICYCFSRPGRFFISIFLRASAESKTHSHVLLPFPLKSANGMSHPDPDPHGEWEPDPVQYQQS